MNGCCGAMGRTITNLAHGMDDLSIVAGVDLRAAAAAASGSPGMADALPYPVFPALDVCEVHGDVVVDFSSPKALDGVLAYCSSRGVPGVLCTTGLSPDQVRQVAEAAGEVALLRSANMSLGINLLSKLLKEAAVTLAQAGFDIEVVEKHHNQKVDAPSGTALLLADSMKGALADAVGRDYHYTYDRSARREKRDPVEIGISAIRGGSIVGEHDVIFAGTDEVITFSHTIYSKAVFGKGALSAAKFLAGKGPGLYTMSDVIGG